MSTEEALPVTGTSSSSSISLSPSPSPSLTSDEPPATTDDTANSPEILEEPLERHDTELTTATYFSAASNGPNAQDDNDDGGDDDGSDNGMSFGHYLGAVANLCSATLGAGILALPFALYQAGLIFGGLLLLSSAWATAASIQLLVEASEKYQLATYEKVVEKILGPKVRQMVEISILIFCGGTAVAYVIAVGDIMERVEHLSDAYKKLAMIIVWALAMLPLSCLRRMQSLQCASTVGIASIFTLLLAATVHLLHPDTPGNDSSSGDGYQEIGGGFFMGTTNSYIDRLEPFFGPADGGWLSVLRACPIVFFAFSCQVNVNQIYAELPGVTGEEKRKAMNRVTWIAVGLCGLLYASVSLVTLMDFGDHVTPNILSCYTLNPRETLLHVAFLAMALAVVMAFPLNVFPARVSVIQMWDASKKPELVLTFTPLDADVGSRSAGRENNFNNDAQTPLLPAQERNGDSGYRSGDELENGLSNEDPLQSATATDSLRTASVAQENRETHFVDEPNEDSIEFKFGEHVGFTLLIAGVALGLALVVPNISVVFGLLGGTTSSLLGFVVPGWLGIRMDRSNITAWLLIIAGAIIGVLTTGVTVYSTIQDMI